jgi:hypothetical protein
MADATTDAMLKYGDHRPACRMRVRMGEPCDCGWSERRLSLLAMQSARQPPSQVPAEDDELVANLERVARHRLENPDLALEWKARDRIISLRRRLDEALAVIDGRITSLTALQVTEGDKRDIIFGILARRAFNEELLGHVIEATDEICAALHSNQEGEG